MVYPFGDDNRLEGSEGVPSADVGLFGRADDDIPPTLIRGEMTSLPFFDETVERFDTFTMPHPPENDMDAVDDELADITNTSRVMRYEDRLNMLTRQYDRDQTDINDAHRHAKLLEEKAQTERNMVAQSEARAGEYEQKAREARILAQKTQDTKDIQYLNMQLKESERLLKRSHYAYIRAETVYNETKQKHAAIKKLLNARKGLDDEENKASTSPAVVPTQADLAHDHTPLPVPAPPPTQIYSATPPPPSHDQTYPALPAPAPPPTEMYSATPPPFYRAPPPVSTLHAPFLPPGQQHYLLSAAQTGRLGPTNAPSTLPPPHAAVAPVAPVWSVGSVGPVGPVGPVVSGESDNSASEYDTIKQSIEELSKNLPDMPDFPSGG